MEQYALDLIEHLSGFVTENRFSLFQQVLADRTRYISVVLEDIYQSHNASAVLRTCDCTGIQDVHIIEQRNEYEINPDVALGSNRWLSLHYYSNEAEGTRRDGIYKGVEALKKQGYRIVATSPHTEGSTPETFNLEKGKSAIMFGTELDGLTDRPSSWRMSLYRFPWLVLPKATIFLYQQHLLCMGCERGWKSHP